MLIKIDFTGVRYYPSPEEFDDELEHELDEIYRDPENGFKIADQ